LLVVVETDCPCGVVSETLACGTTAPEGSLTTPRNVPDAVCAHRRTVCSGNENANQRKIQIPDGQSFIILPRTLAGC
jgi:hypothetical protein